MSRDESALGNGFVRTLREYRSPSIIEKLASAVLGQPNCFDRLIADEFMSNARIAGVFCPTTVERCAPLQRPPIFLYVNILRSFAVTIQYE